MQIPIAPEKHQRASLWPLLIIAGAVVAIYINSIWAPFEFDDLPSIPDNPTIRSLWPLSGPLSPPSGWGHTVEGRPLLNLSLAVNFALSGYATWSYHFFNIAIHTLAGLTLFGIIRRTFAGPVLRKRFGQDATIAALAGALFWALHPVETEAVTYIIQRAESLASLFLLLTLYCFIRLVAAPTKYIWWSLAVLASLCGMATKEIMVTAPVLVFLYDRTFVAGSFREAWGQRRQVHLSLAATWLLLLWLVAGSGSRGGTYDLTNPQAWWTIGLTQFVAVAHYLQLIVWPHPLVFDYGVFRIESLASVLPQALLVLGLLAGVVYALRRYPTYGFLGCWFFIILAPTSVLPGNQQMIVEHRMYLSLAAGAGLVAHLAMIVPRRTAIAACLIIASTLGPLTYLRNQDYQSVVALWADTVAKRPANARALCNFGGALYSAGRTEEALEKLQKSLLLDPKNADTHFNLGLVADRKENPKEAAAYYIEAARLRPLHATAHFKAGLALAKANCSAEAIEQLQLATLSRPDAAEAHGNLGSLLVESGRITEGMAHCEQALQLKPDYAEAEGNLGIALLRLNRTDEAIAHLRRAVKLKPGLEPMHFNLGIALESIGKPDEAMIEYLEAVRLDGKHAEAHLNLGIMQAKAGDNASALTNLETAVQLRPEVPEVQANLGSVLMATGRLTEAVDHFDAALALRPAYAMAHYNLANALLELRRWPEAETHFEQALKIEPGFQAAREMLGRMRSIPVSERPTP